jgi:hypothetical protein
MTLSFLYQVFCRVLQLIRLTFRKDIDLAIEIVMLRPSARTTSTRTRRFSAIRMPNSMHWSNVDLSPVNS